jgi:DNA processing protein
VAETNQSATASAKSSNNLDEQRVYWLALALTPGLGPTRIRKLLERFENPAAVFSVSLTELEAVGLQAASAQAIALGKSLQLAEEEKVKAQAAGAQIICLEDDLFPSRLKEIYDPPPVLYVRGDATVLSDFGIAVVGTRHPTPYGIGMSERLANDLAGRGLVIISGMARGVDSAAHRGALNAKGKTVAVWGTGIDVIYPKENKKLIDPILQSGGALITEFPVGAFAAPQNFPIRNRLISGLSIGVLVVEAAEYSGTRVTSRCAIEQGREVFAVPGNVTNKNSWGPNTLIKQGAKLTATWEDVWEELPHDVKVALGSRTGVESKSSPETSLFGDSQFSPTERRVYQVLRADEALQIDEVIGKLESEISSSEIFAALFELELAGKIRQLPGKNYVRVF